MSEIPSGLIECLDQVISQSGDPSGIVSSTSLGGGSINLAFRVQTRENRYMLKWGHNARPHYFLSEKTGLDMIRETNTIRVPWVLNAADQTEFCPAYILLEWIESPELGNGNFNHELLGHELAMMHLADYQLRGKPVYGFHEDNYIGRIEQINTQKANWIDFFRENRLMVQIQIAQTANLLTLFRRKRLDRFVVNLEKWLGGVERAPSLLHGDLWHGNVIGSVNGEPYLLDPAVYYGDREADLAFTEMFGGFGTKFYAAYQETWQIQAGYDDRKHVYNLYHYLNHLNHFGETYGANIDRILQHYVG